MTVDVVIPVRAPAPWLPQAVASTRGQGCLGRVLVAMDRCARDDLPRPDAAVDGEGVRIDWIASSGTGASAARNAGLDAARSPHVVFLDADDQLEPGALAALLEGVDDRHPIVVGGWRHIDADGRPLPGGAAGETCDTEDGLRWMCDVAPPAGPVLLPRTAQRWDESRAVWEVTRYFNRVAASSCGLRRLAAPVVAIRQHEDVERASLVHRHFAADVVLAFWLEEYEWARNLGSRGDAARPVIARRLLAAAYARLRAVPDEPADHRVLAFAEQDRWDRMLDPRAGSAAWFALRFGARGLRWFRQLNALIGR